MASMISYEYLQDIKGAPNGLATLDAVGKVPLEQLPSSVIETYKGLYATSEALITAYPTANLADYAYVDATMSYWYWNSALTTPAWVNQEITVTDYTVLSTKAKAAVPYIIIP